MTTRAQAEPVVLLERDAELVQLRAAVGAARSGAATVVVVEGPAGIGKSELVAAARREAGAAGLTVLHASGSELEHEFAHGVVRQLLEPALAAADDAVREDLLTGAAALAGAVVDPRGAGAAGELSVDSRFAVHHGLYWLCANLARRAPLVLAVDDAHWADLASLRFLAYLARRLQGMPVVLVVARRPPAGGAADELLQALAEAPESAVVRPAPLSGAAVADLLAAGLGDEPDALFVEAAMEATGGLPFLVLELIREAQEQGLAPTAAAAVPLEELRSGVVARTIAGRMRRLAPAAGPVARAVAVLGADATVARIARVSGVDRDAVLVALDTLAAADIVVRREAVEFAHPLVRAAVETELPAADRQRFHARAAQLLREEGAREERVAAHVLATQPSGDAAAVDTLVAAGRSALATGATSSAVAYLRRAAAEPPAPALLAFVLHELGRAEAAEGRRTEFETTLRRAMELSPDTRSRGRMALDLGRALASAGDFAAAVEVLEAGLVGLEDDASQLSIELESELYPLGLNEFSGTRSVRQRLSRRIAQLDRGELTEPLLLGPVALALASRRPPASDGAAAATIAAADERFEPNSIVPGAVGNALLFAGRLADAVAVYDRGVAAARARGARLTVAFATVLGANVRLHQGRLAEAEQEARFGLELLEEAEVDRGSSAFGYAAAHLAEILLERGAVEEADELLASAPFREPPASRYPDSLLYGARSRLRLAQGRYEEALAAALGSALQGTSPAVRPWRSDAAQALARLGRAGEGAALAAEELSLARAFDVPEATGVALRACAACARVDVAVPLLREAVAELERSEARLEHARALLDLGATLRRAGRRSESREHLRAALDLADRSGARAVADQARVELLASGARPRRLRLSGVDSLTPSERRIAQLAARGATNRDIAQSLFVTVRTVEGHLTHVFQKLGIESRAQLTERLATEPLPQPRLWTGTS